VPVKKFDLGLYNRDIDSRETLCVLTWEVIMSTTTISHTHLNSRFRKLPVLIETDEGEFTDYCLNCESPAGFRYISTCLEGCEVEVTECGECATSREVRL
jgi:hypothetical protein